MNRTVLSKLLPLAVFVGSLSLATNAHAVSLTIGDANYLGLIDDGIPSGSAEQLSYLNFLKGLAPGAVVPNGVGDEDFTRSANVLCFPTCPTAVAAGSVSNTTDPATFSGLPGGFTYLYVKYDGPNFGVAVWYVAGLAGPIDFPEFGSGGQFRVSHWQLYNPTDSTLPGVPEPASLVLMGTGLAALAFRLRRRRNA